MIVKSHKHFTQILTRTFYKTIVDYINLDEAITISRANEENRGISTISNAATAATGSLSPINDQIIATINSAISISGSVNPYVQNAAVSPAAFTFPRRTVSWELAINSIALGSGDDVLIRDLDFFIRLTMLDDGDTTGTKFRTLQFSLLNNIGGDEKVSRFNTIFPNGLMVSSYGTLKQTPRTDYDRDFQPNLFINDDADIECFMGSYGEYNKIEIGVGLKDYSAVPNLTINHDFRTHQSNETTWVEGLNTASKTALTDAPLPMFDTIGNGNNQLQLHTYHSYMSKGLKIWANQGLLNMIGFDSSEYSPSFSTLEYTSSNIFTGSATELTITTPGTGYTAGTTLDTTMTSAGGSGLTPTTSPQINVVSVGGSGEVTAVSVASGGVGLTKGMLFRLTGGGSNAIVRISRINTSDEVNLKGGILEYDYSIIQNAGVVQDDKEISIIEPELSVYKRNFLYGLAITGNSFSISGEYEGEGKSTRKILSDFESDPSTNFRDYYIYQPSGNSVRYYQMNTTMPLRDIFVSVFYRDMNGNYQLLKLGAGYIASIKLHFRLKQN